MGNCVGGSVDPLLLSYQTKLGEIRKALGFNDLKFLGLFEVQNDGKSIRLVLAIVLIILFFSFFANSEKPFKRVIL